MADALTGKQAKQQVALAREAQARQAAEIADQKRRVGLVEEGQRAITRGGGGLFAFIDQKLRGAANQLGTTLGGGASRL